MKNFLAKIQKDKLQHFIVCAIASILSPWFGAGLGLGKEFGDWQHGGKWDWWDILADACGVVVGGAIHYLSF